MKLDNYHIGYHELACHDKNETPYPEVWRNDRLPKLVSLFESLRRHCREALVVNCGYRTIDHNREVGGAASSQHIQGRALDIATPGSYKNAKSFHIDVETWAATEPNLGGLGLYDWGVHIDTRDRKDINRFAFWDFRTKH